eukprot:COSAG01_NODE_3392_length_6150_cov_6.923814_8_plen_147_part_00
MDVVAWPECSLTVAPASARHREREREGNHKTDTGQPVRRLKRYRASRRACTCTHAADQSVPAHRSGDRDANALSRLSRAAVEEEYNVRCGLCCALGSVAWRWSTDLGRGLAPSAISRACPNAGGGPSFWPSARVPTSQPRSAETTR